MGGDGEEGGAGRRALQWPLSQARMSELEEALTRIRNLSKKGEMRW